MIKNLIRMALIGLSMIFVSVSSYADTKVQFALDWKFGAIKHLTLLRN